MQIYADYTKCMQIYANCTDANLYKFMIFQLNRTPINNTLQLQLVKEPSQTPAVKGIVTEMLVLMN